MSPDRDILVRGEQARLARPVNLATVSSVPALTPVGPWTSETDKTMEEARRKGYAQGLLEGRDVGRRASLDELERRNTEMAAAIRNLIDRLNQRAEDLGRHLAAEVVDLALEIASAVLEREIGAATDPGAEAITRCLNVAPMLGDLVAQLHPDDAARLGHVLALADRRLTVVPDPALKAGDVIVTIDDTTIDGRVNEALERIREVLR